MKYLERTFYRGYWYYGNGSSMTIKNWFGVKDNVFRGIKHVTKRHRHSVTSRTLKQICGYTAFREEAHRHRFFIYRR